MRVEPEPVMNKPVDLDITHKSTERERRPDEGIACQERCLYRSWMLLLSTGMTQLLPDRDRTGYPRNSRASSSHRAACRPDSIAASVGHLAACAPAPRHPCPAARRARVARSASDGQDR